MHRYKNFALLCVSLPVLIWRVVDFIQEAVSGLIKMSLGPLHLEGPIAVFLQLSLIACMIFVVTKVARDVGYSNG